MPIEIVKWTVRIDTGIKMTAEACLPWPHGGAVVPWPLVCKPIDYAYPRHVVGQIVNIVDCDRKQAFEALRDQSMILISYFASYLSLVFIVRLPPQQITPHNTFLP